MRQMDNDDAQSSSSAPSSPAPPPGSFGSGPLSAPRQAALRRITLITATAATLSAAYASFRNFPARVIVTASTSTAVLTAPLAAVREALTARLHVDGPVASAIVGGFAGYAGAYALSSASHSALRISARGAVVFGVGAGLLDAVISGLDQRRKAFIVARREADEVCAAAAAGVANPPSAATAPLPAPVTSKAHACSCGAAAKRGLRSESGSMSASSISSSVGGGVALKTGGALRGECAVCGQRGAHEAVGESITGNEVIAGSNATPDGWPVWLPVLKQVDDEYEDLVLRREATAAALHEEQERIARLLKAIESLKASENASVHTGG